MGYSAYDTYRQEQENKRRQLGGGATYSGGGKYYADGKTFDSYQQLIDYQQKRTKIGDQERELQRNLSIYDEATGKFVDKTLQDFRTSSEYQGARQVGAINQAAGQFAMRRNLGDEFTAALTAEQQGQMRQQITQANMDFESKLSQLMNAERIGFIKGEFDFFHRLQAMDYGHELSKDMARFQAELASDFQFMDAFGGMLELGGTVLGSVLFPPAAPVVASQWIGPRNF